MRTIRMFTTMKEEGIEIFKTPLAIYNMQMQRRKVSFIKTSQTLPNYQNRTFFIVYFLQIYFFGLNSCALISWYFIGRFSGYFFQKLFFLWLSYIDSCYINASSPLKMPVCALCTLHKQLSWKQRSAHRHLARKKFRENHKYCRL